MNRQSELSKFKLYYEDIHPASYWRALMLRTTMQLMREHIQRPLGHVAVIAPAMVRRRRK